ncbi:MAG TPA: serine hydrolase domain-containing protein [Candidatus Saccharimonadales bacterium]|nr:serine hydrolase domain-containing protein [Candidatus Saccharimonadales bacterium]
MTIKHILNRLTKYLLTQLAAVVLIVAAILIPTTSASALASSGIVGKTTDTQIESYIQQQAKAAHIPGIAFGIVQGNKTTLLGGYGNVNPNTPFFLASLSKSFTALAIMQLVDQGKVSLNAPVKQYIPWFKVGNGSESDSMTVMELLDQTSGLSNKAGLTALTFKPTTTLPQAIKGFEGFSLVAKPGKTFQYSNANYMVAGYIVQQSSGQSYDSYVQQHIFTPLDMTHTYAMTGTAHEAGLTKGSAVWFGFKLPLTEKVAPALIPDGYIISSASDMTHYLIMQLNGGIYDGTRIVSAKAIQEMHTGFVSLPNGQSPVPDTNSYGLGWGVGTINGTPIIAHDGQLRDFQTNMAILPDKNIAVVMLINQDPQLLNEGQTFQGVLQGITTGAFPSISHIFIIFYVIFDLVVLASILLMIRSFWKISKWLKKFQNKALKKGFANAFIKTIGLDLCIAIIIAVAVFYGLGSVFGYVPLTPTLMIFALPDVSVWLYVVIGFFVLRALVKIAIVSYWKKDVTTGHGKEQ